MAPTRSPTTTLKQIAMVLDLNKCLGCQTCAVACKVLWTQDEGEDYQWWCTVNTIPGRGHPRDWEQIGGGWHFNYEEVYSSAEHIPLRPINGRGATEWGPNWDEDEGGGQWPNSYFFYLPPLRSEEHT